MSRIYFLNRYFYPDQSATSLIASGLAFGLSAAGKEVEVITTGQLYEHAASRLPACETIRGVTIRRLQSTKFGRGRLAGRFLDYGSFYIKAMHYLFGAIRPGDIVIAMTDPPMLSIGAAHVAKYRKAHLINWLQDIFPEIALQLNVGGRMTRLPFHATRALRNRSLRTARKNVAIGQSMARYLELLSVKTERITVIPNWADPALVAPQETSSLRHLWNLTNKIVVGYSGNFGRAHDASTLIGAIEIIQNRAKQDPVAARIVFVFIGGGELKNTIARAANSLALNNVRLEPYQPLSQLSDTLALPDIHLVSLRPDLEGFVVPSKVYGIMAAARPTIFIGAQDGEIPRMLERHHIGLSSSTGCSTTLASTILQLASDAELRRRMGDKAREVFLDEFTLGTAIQRWCSLIDEVAPPSCGTPHNTPDQYESTDPSLRN